MKKSKTFRFSDSELELLEELKGDGSYTEAIVAGLYALKGGQAADSKVVADMLRKLADQVDPS